MSFHLIRTDNAIECFHEIQPIWTEHWLQRNVKTTITVQEARLRAIALAILLNDKHRNFGSVTTRIEHLFNGEFTFIETLQVEFYFAEQRWFDIGRGKVVFENTSGS